jgi:hypothetical protein
LYGRVGCHALQCLLIGLVLLLLLLLGCCHQDPKRDRFKLILNCIMIITSVIPPGAPNSNPATAAAAAATAESRSLVPVLPYIQSSHQTQCQWHQEAAAAHAASVSQHNRR